MVEHKDSLRKFMDAKHAESGATIKLSEVYDLGRKDALDEVEERLTGLTDGPSNEVVMDIIEGLRHATK